MNEVIDCKCRKVIFIRADIIRGFLLADMDTCYHLQIRSTVNPLKIKLFILFKLLGDNPPTPPPGFDPSSRDFKK